MIGRLVAVSVCAYLALTLDVQGKWSVQASEDEDEASEFAAMLQRFNKPMTELTMASSEYSNLIVQLLRVLRNEYHWCVCREHVYCCSFS